MPTKMISCLKRHWLADVKLVIVCAATFWLHSVIGMHVLNKQAHCCWLAHCCWVRLCGGLLAPHCTLSVHKLAACHGLRDNEMV